MDYNKYLLRTFLPTGIYDTRIIKEDKKCIFLNKFCAIICLIVTIKGIFIVLFPDYIFHLIELYIFKSIIQKYFHVCLFIMHFGTFYEYFYYSKLNADKLKCLNFLFIPDINDLCKYYDLELNPTIKFIKIAELYRKVALYTLIIRCLIVGYFEIRFIYWILFALPCTIVTFFAYYLIVYSTLAAYLLLLISMRFLILRSNTICKIILKKINDNTKYSSNQKLKDKLHFNRIIKSIGSIVIQFNEMNSIFSNMISIIYSNCIFGTLVFPSFLFFPFPIYFKIMSMFLYFLALIFVNFSIAIFNDKFIKKIKILDNTIHNVMPKFKGIRLKMAFNNYLILSNRYKNISFTYLNSFNYSTYSLIEYVMHSLSLFFMVYQAINLKLNN